MSPNIYFFRNYLVLNLNEDSKLDFYAFLIKFNFVVEKLTLKKSLLWGQWNGLCGLN